MNEVTQSRQCYVKILINLFSLLALSEIKILLPLQDFLLPLQQLTSLILHNIDELLDEGAVENISTLKKLR